MKKKIARNIIIIICVMLVLWVAAGVVDFFRVQSLKKPIFALKTETVDDGGSGMYYGLGYSFEINGSFMPEDELSGVTHYKFYVFNSLITDEIRD